MAPLPKLTGRRRLQDAIRNERQKRFGAVALLHGKAAFACSRGAHGYLGGQAPLLAASPSNRTPFLPIAASNRGLSFSYCHGLRWTIVSRVGLHMHTAPVDRIGRCVLQYLGKWRNCLTLCSLARVGVSWMKRLASASLTIREGIRSRRYR